MYLQQVEEVEGMNPGPAIIRREGERAQLSWVRLCWKT